LPEYHNKIAKEKLDRLTLMEAELKSRDELNQSQLLHRQSMIELQRKEAMDEVQRYRERMELKFSEERYKSYCLRFLLFFKTSDGFIDNI
jgi:hypothetical protein